MGFFEYITPGAITQETLDKSDIFCLFNHDENKVLGRSLNGKGNLKFTIDDYGVKYDCRLLDNEVAKTARSYVDNGLIDSSSFAFMVSKEDGAQEWSRGADGVIRRTIRKIDRLFDASPVWDPAYTETTCSCRAYDEFIEKENRQKAEEELYKQELEDYRAKIEALG